MGRSTSHHWTKATLMIDKSQLLQQVFLVVLDLPEGTEVTAIRRLTEPKWDSLAHTTLVFAIESEFDVSLSAQETERITSFAGARLLLEEKCLL
jgi:acyl carrier protein